MSGREAVIAGVGLSDVPRAPYLDTFEHHALAPQRALADCGIAKPEIEG